MPWQLLVQMVEHFFEYIFWIVNHMVMKLGDKIVIDIFRNYVAWFWELSL